MSSKNFVVLDTSALEAQYLGPVLNGDACRDLRAIEDCGYQPAILQKSLTEIWRHVQLGNGNSLRWARTCADYPGPIDGQVSTIERFLPELDARKTAHLWFSLSQEWCHERSRLDTAQRHFLNWKNSSTAFCRRIETALLASNVAVLRPPAHPRNKGGDQRLVSLERELALHSLVPTEDAAWLLDALLVYARAVITCDRRVIERGRLSMGVNLGAPSMVHPTRLHEALADAFGLGSYGT